MYSGKDTSPDFTEFQKSNKNWEIYLVLKILQGEVYFEPCFQLIKKNELGQLEKSQQVYLGKKEGDIISAIRNTVIRYA